MSTKENQAVYWYEQGWNCAQSVAAAAAVREGDDPRRALRAAAGFGGGMGRMQSTCGALTGGIMALGFQGPDPAGPDDNKGAMYARVQSLWAHFTRQWGGHACRELLPCDLRTPEGQAEYRERELSRTICRECVATVDRWLTARRKEGA